MINRYIYKVVFLLFVINCEKESSHKQYNQSRDKGYDLYIEHACNTCHSLDGSRMNGPTFKDIYGKTVYFYNDKSSIVDDEYLINSIISPGKDIVRGYPNLMPSYNLEKDQLEALIDFIKKQ